MIIKLVPQQIPIFWEAIKKATTMADEVDEKDYPAYLNKMLHALLNDKNQCFIRLNKDRVLVALVVTQLGDNLFSGQKTLLIKTLYSWQPAVGGEWQEDFALIKEFAEKERCSYITFESRHRRVQEIGESIGFREATRVFSLEV